MTHELAILGAGNMAEAIVRGLLSQHLYTPSQIIAADPAEPRRALFESLGIKTTPSNAEASKGAKILLLSTKPQVMAEALQSIAPTLSPDTLIISIAAGISTAFIERHLTQHSSLSTQHSPIRVIRTMPNTPMLVGKGIAGIAKGAHATDQDLATARKLFQTAAEVVDVPEDQIDTVTAVSGSGPAYFFLLVEQMIQAGQELGLSPEVAHKLATQTALGSAAMLTAPNADPPATLRQKVTSPKGTTYAAITHMESHNLPQIIRDAIKAAQKRGRELGV